MADTRLRAAVSVVLAASLLGGCQVGRVIHDDGDGPLSAMSGTGSFMMERDTSSGRSATWTGSNGSFVLCAQTPGVAIELQSVGWAAAADAVPVKVEAWLRLVDRSTEPTTAFISMAGTPWDPAPGRQEQPGTFTRKLAGRTVADTCEDLDRSRTERGMPEFTELIFVMTVGDKGGEIERAYVDHLADGEPHRLMINWTMGMCGTAIEARGGDEKAQCAG